VTGKSVEEPEDEDRRSECDRDRETARARDWTRMAPAAAWDIEHSELTRDHAHEWRRDRGKREREHR
jgi:hypothetical protein